MVISCLVRCSALNKNIIWGSNGRSSEFAPNDHCSVRSCLPVSYDVLTRTEGQHKVSVINEIFYWHAGFKVFLQAISLGIISPGQFPKIPANQSWLHYFPLLQLLGIPPNASLSAHFNAAYPLSLRPLVGGMTSSAMCPLRL